MPVQPACLPPQLRGPFALRRPRLLLVLFPAPIRLASQGRNGDITVTISVSGNAIVKIEVASHTETAQFGGKALAEMPPRIGGCPERPGRYSLPVRP